MALLILDRDDFKNDGSPFALGLSFDSLLADLGVEDFENVERVSLVVHKFSAENENGDEVSNG